MWTGKGMGVFPLATHVSRPPPSAWLDASREQQGHGTSQVTPTLCTQRTEWWILHCSATRIRRRCGPGRPATEPARQSPPIDPGCGQPAAFSQEANNCVCHPLTIVGLGQADVFWVLSLRSESPGVCPAGWHCGSGIQIRCFSLDGHRQFDMCTVMWRSVNVQK